MLLKRLTPLLACLLLLSQGSSALSTPATAYKLKKNPGTAPVAQIQPAFDAEALLALEVQAAQAFVQQKAAAKQLVLAQRRADNEKIIAPIMALIVKEIAPKPSNAEKIKDTVKGIFSKSNPKKDEAPSWPTTVQPQISAETQAAQSAYNTAKQNLEGALAQARISASGSQIIFVDLIDFSKRFRESADTPLHTTLFDDDPDCAGDIIGDSLIAKYGVRATQAAVSTDAQAATAKRSEAILHLTRYTQQLMCLDAMHLALVDHSLAKALEGSSNSLLDAVLNPVLVTFNESKFMGSKLFAILSARAEIVKQANEAGKITGGMGVWVRNFSTGRLQQTGFATSPSGNNSPFESIQYQLGTMGMEGFSAFGVPLDKLMETCNVISMGSAPMEPATPSWGEAVDIFTDPMQMGSGSESLIDSAFQNVPDTQGSCGGGGAAGGGDSEANKAIACAMAAMASWAETPRVCQPGVSPLKPMTGNSTPSESGQAALGQDGGSPLCTSMGTGCGQTSGEVKPTDVVYKSSITCGAGNAVGADEPSKQKEPVDLLQKKKMDESKKIAQKMVEDNADWAVDTYESRTQTSVPEDVKAAAIANALERVGDATAAPLKDTPAGNVVMGETRDGSNEIYVSKDFFNRGSKLSVSSELPVTLAHEGMHVLLNTLGSLMGNTLTEEQDHTFIEDELGWICAESSTSCATACTGQEISANMYMSCSKDASLPHVPDAAGDCKNDAECIGPQDGAQPPANMPGNLGVTPDGPSSPPEGGIVCDMGDKVINLIDHFGAVDPSPIMPFDQDIMEAPVQNLLTETAPRQSGTLREFQIQQQLKDAKIPPEINP